MPELNPTDEFDSLSSAAVPGVDATERDERTDGESRAQTSLSDELDAARAQADAARAQAAEQRNLYLRALADFDNYRKRAERDISDLSQRGRREAIKRILPVLDNLARAEEYRERGTPPEQIVDGLLQTSKQLLAALAAEDVRPIDVLGKPFDPAVAEAIATQPADDGVKDNTVVAEAAKGYYIGDEVLRPAQVVVAKRM
ncbi:MAG: nucleotide exchange factor GrpE [Candidatus Eremiobacteraeota bacterium]|nr:nucleotide exchange factor GrpE [Candidatus Eremiobacteraeota bacterium]MBV8365622.1 nucleotide exchange factor GrpE [Candidatus Eremiobacteraeota bacterium]